MAGFIPTLPRSFVLWAGMSALVLSTWSVQASSLLWIVPWWSQSQDPTWLARSLVLPCPTLTLSVWPLWQVSLCDLSSKMTGCVIMVGSRFSKHKKLKQPVLLRAWPQDQCRIDSCSVLGVVTGPAQAQRGWEYEWIYTRFSLVVSVTSLCINR